MTIAEGSSKQIEGEECDDDVEVRWVGECMARFCLFSRHYLKQRDDDDVGVRWVGECMASVFQWDSRAASIEFQWLIARQIHQLRNWNQLG